MSVRSRGGSIPCRLRLDHLFVRGRRSRSFEKLLGSDRDGIHRTKGSRGTISNCFTWFVSPRSRAILHVLISTDRHAFHLWHECENAGSFLFWKRRWKMEPPPHESEPHEDIDSFRSDCTIGEDRVRKNRDLKCKVNELGLWHDWCIHFNDLSEILFLYNLARCICVAFIMPRQTWNMKGIHLLRLLWKV